MKRLLILIVLLAFVICPSIALESTFNDYVPITTNLPAIQGDWLFNADGINLNTFSNVDSADSYGRVKVRIKGSDAGTDYGYIKNVDAVVFTYAAWTQTYTVTGSPPRELVVLYSTTGATLWSTTYVPSNGRYEIIITSGVARIYLDGSLVATSGGLASNPAYLQIQSYPPGGVTNQFFTIDDVILGTIADTTIIGLVPSDYYIFFDSAAPASTGLYKSNYPAAPTLINSNFFGMTYGRGTATTANLILRDPNGLIRKNYPVSNMSLEGYLPIADMYDAGEIINGRWSVYFDDAPSDIAYIWVYADGATVSWNSATYAQQDTASISYSITAGRWNPALYTYSLKIIDVFGNIINTQSITSQTGSLSYTWTDTDALGVYYAEIFQTSIADPSSVVLLNYDTTTLTGTFSFSGYVLDAESAAPLAGAGVNFTQLGTPRVSLSAADGSYSASGFVTGGSVIVNVTKTGYVQYYNTITPTRSRNIALNLSILSTNPTKVGATLGSIFRDLTYGNLIPGVAATATNGSTVITGTTNNAGYVPFYNLVNGTCYRISGSKTGYAMPTSNPTGSLKCAGGIL